MPAATGIPPAPHYHAGGQLSYTIIGAYIVVTLIVVFLLPSSSITGAIWTLYLLGLILVFLLGRYLSTGYRIDSDRLIARRILGGRTIRLEEVRKIEFENLRDLSPTGFFGSWGYRGRMWSPVIGSFDAIYTSSAGILVTAGTHPIFISPKHPVEFARELSRRVRSYRGALAVDVGAPEGPAPGLE